MAHQSSGMLKYYILDVFAKSKYQGNQLAVFIDLEDQLSAAQMLEITREINFAESSFIKKKKADNEYEVRIFTPQYEVPFAGHPSIGTSFIIAKYLSEKRPSEVVLNLAQGDIKVALSENDNLEESLFTMQQTQPIFKQSITTAELSNGLNIPMEYIDSAQAIEEITTGLPYLIIPLKGLKEMEQVKLEPSSFQQFLLQHQMHHSNSTEKLSTSLFFYTTETYEPGNDFNTRMFILENDKIVEDAATGSANGCFLAYLLKYQSNKISANIEQGFQMNRKSYLILNGKEEDGQYEIGVGGYSKEVAGGEWNIS